MRKCPAFRPAREGTGPGQWLLEMICCKGGRWELKRALFSEFSHVQGICVDWRVAEEWGGLESEYGLSKAALFFLWKIWAQYHQLAEGPGVNMLRTCVKSRVSRYSCVTSKGSTKP